MIFPIFGGGPFDFLTIEFDSTLSISYKVLPYYVYYYCIVISSSVSSLYFFCSHPK